MLANNLISTFGEIALFPHQREVLTNTNLGVLAQIYLILLMAGLLAKNSFHQLCSYFFEDILRVIDMLAGFPARRHPT